MKKLKVENLRFSLPDSGELKKILSYILSGKLIPLTSRGETRVVSFNFKKVISFERFKIEERKTMRDFARERKPS